MYSANIKSNDEITLSKSKSNRSDGLKNQKLKSEYADKYLDQGNFEQIFNSLQL